MLELLLVIVGAGASITGMPWTTELLQPFTVILYCTVIVPEPVAVRVLPLIFPGPFVTVNMPPDGVAVNNLDSSGHIEELLLVITGAVGIGFTTIL
jgi:hypothetical protein